MQMNGFLAFGVLEIIGKLPIISMTFIKMHRFKKLEISISRYEMP
jgi:hypothetical protein